MAIEYRTLTPADMQAYKEIRLRALHDAPTVYSSSWESQRALPNSFFLARVTPEPDNFVIGALAGDTLVGIGGGFVDAEIKRQHIGYVVGMWVDVDYRGSGIARSLLAKVMADLAKVDRVTHLQLTLTEGNTSALRLYEDVGFTLWGREPGALLVGGTMYNDLHMSLTL